MDQGLREKVMEKILYLAHTETDGSLGKPALEALGAAVDLSKKMGSPLTVGLIGADIKKAADSIASCGATQTLGVAGADFSVSRYSTDALALECLAKEAQATLIVAPGTSRLARVLPGVTYRLGGQIDTHVAATPVEGPSLSIQRWYYRQRMMATLTRQKRPWALLLDTGVFAPWTGSGGQASVKMLEPGASDALRRTQVTGFESATAGPQTVRPDADLLFVAGAGWMKKQADGKTHVKEAETLIVNLLERTRASLGSSKSLVDQSGEGQEVISILSHLNQVGQTGSTPRHPKGLAACCHGEEPHAVGWRFINERRAINLDPGCGWSQGKADVLYVADAFQVLAKVNELLAKG